MGDSLSVGLDALIPGPYCSALNASRDAAAVAKLKEACAAAYKAHPDSCSHAVNAVIRAVLGLDMTAWPHRQANGIVAYMIQSTDWKEVTLDRAYELALQGVPVVGGKAEYGCRNGHVIIVYPGLRKPRGGYSFTATDGTLKTMATKGSYPLAMSTSLGSWPGAKSDGSKTVYDPWGNDTAFALVKFWAPAKQAAAKADISGAVRAKTGFGFG
jgi:hypothetical protein